MHHPPLAISPFPRTHPEVTAPAATLWPHFAGSQPAAHWVLPGRSSLRLILLPLRKGPLRLSDLEWLPLTFPSVLWFKHEASPSVCFLQGDS